MYRIVLLVGIMIMAQGCGGALISGKQEQRIGSGVDKQLKKEYRLVHSSDPVSKWAQEFIRPLVKGSQKFRNPKAFGGYKVAVIADDKLVNAFAAPGGYTYLSTGLILQSKDCAEIAGVMGHELAHVTERHGAKSIEKQFAAQQIIGFFLSDGLAAGSATLLWNFLSSTTFSREDERSADTVGLQIAYNAGYDPNGLADFFGVLLKSSGSQPPEFLSSHPATKSRIRSVRSQIKKRYGAKATSGSRTRKCKTKMSLAAVKSRIKSGKMKLGAKPTEKKKSRTDAAKAWKKATKKYRSKYVKKKKKSSSK